MRNCTILLALFAAFVLALGTPAQAGTIDLTDSLVPSGLGEGDTFHLAFLTSDTRDATSTNIADYNTFVGNVAENTGSLVEGKGWNWYAIGSTAAVDARDNAVVSAPVYLLDGSTKVADDYTDMWDGSVDNPINMYEDGTTETSTSLHGWAGTDFDGTGQTVLGNSFVDRMIPNYNNAGAWIYAWADGHGSQSNSTARVFYALSEELTVVSTVPEPTSFALCLLGLLGLALYRRWR